MFNAKIDRPIIIIRVIRYTFLSNYLNGIETLYGKCTYDAHNWFRPK